MTNAKMLKLGVLGAALGAGLYFMLPAPEAAPPPAPAAEPNYFAFVRSMDGTHPDGDIKQTGDLLVVDAELGYMFDYYLAGLGEKNLDAIKTEIERELDRRLQKAPAVQAKRLLDNYLKYKGALAVMEQGMPKSSDLVKGARARLEAMQQLRHAYFSADEISGLFAASDAYDQDALARLEINGDTRLGDSERRARLAALDAKLSPAVREQREAPAAVLKLEQSVQQLRAQGGGDNEVYRLRSAALSPEAAARLAEVDREEDDWKRRISTYQQKYSELKSGTGSVPPDALQQLRDSAFSPDEQRRLAAYE